MIKKLILVPILSLALAVPALAEKIPLNQLSGYLNKIKSASADFTQINGDGSISKGKVYLRRPGRARFEYAPPDKSLVIAGGGKVAVFDVRSNVPPEQFPLKRTPLGLILAENLNLNNSKMVVGHSDDGTATTLTVQDPKHPEYGNMQLKFTGNPVQLRQWIITNEAGDQTTVVLGKFARNVKLNAGVFSITKELQNRGFED